MRLRLVAAMALVLMSAGCQLGDRAAVTSTSPADGATLAQAPTEASLELSGPVDPSRSHVLVTDGSGTVLTAGTLQQVVPQRLRQPISVPAAGEVTVEYHVTSADGAALTGSWRFTVGSGADAGEPAAAHVHGHDIDPVSAGLLVADGLVVLIVVLLLLRRPRQVRGQDRH